MSQKTNPVSLRLQNSNKHFESCWYSDIFYHQVLSDEIQLRTYIESVFYQAARSKTLPSLQSQYRRYCTFLFLLDTRGERHKREYSLKLSREPIQQVLSPKLKFLPNKNKPRICALEKTSGLLFNQAKDFQDKLCRKSLSQDTKYNRPLIHLTQLTHLTHLTRLEDGTKQNIPSFSQNTPQEYVYNYAIKGSYLESLPFSGVVSARSSNGPSPSPTKQSLGSTYREVKLGFPYAYNSIINPELKLRFRKDLPSDGINAFYKKVKGFSSFSMTSLALARCVRGLPYKKDFEEGSVKILALSLSVKKGLDRCEAQLHFGLDVVSKMQNTAFLKAKKAKSSTRNMFTVQSRVHENLFRRLIIDLSSQSTQNRLSYPSQIRFKKQVSCTNTHFIPNKKSFKVAFTSVSLMESKALLFEKIKSSEKTALKNKTTRPVKRRWHRHIELFINLYSGAFGFATLYPVRAISPFQSAGFLIESVAYLLRRKSSFRQIKDDIFRELGQSELIKGMRLSCAGRLGGRSKKAQKAKTQSAQWGETSLTVFSSRLAFASKGVTTKYGKVGVKIWLCYKS